MGKALYRTYRSKSFDELVGQEHITTTLKNALKKGAISHAYLFTGPRGVGKTSTARILAHAINDLPYTDESTHLDIVEIDAASNRRIDEIRDLRDKVHIAPISAKYKVYIIDEVHMLTREAFNALLKTLEEPPAHVVFILATTEAHKVPETILSRTQRFSFRAVSNEDISNHLQEIAKRENITIEPEALALIAAHGAGSFRDSIGLLDQLSGNQQAITADLVRQVIGMPAEEQITELIKAVADADVTEILTKLQDMRAHGIAPAITAKQLAGKLREQLLQDKPIIPRAQLLDIIEALLFVPTRGDQATALELALLKHALRQEAPAQAPQISTPSPKPAQAASHTTVQKPEKKKAEPITEPPKKLIKAVEGSDIEKWAHVLKNAKQAHNTLYSVLRMANISREGSDLHLGFQFSFHVKQISQAKNLTKVQELVAGTFGEPLAISVSVIDNYEEPTHSLAQEKPQASQSATPPDNEISNISNIFGGAELLD